MFLTVWGIARDFKLIYLLCSSVKVYRSILPRYLDFHRKHLWGRELGWSRWTQRHCGINSCPRLSLLPHTFSHLPERGERQGSDDPQAMVSFPGSLLSLKVCMFITSSVLTMVGGWGFCLSLRWHFRDTVSSSTMALQNDRWKIRAEKAEET